MVHRTLKCYICPNKLYFKQLKTPIALVQIVAPSLLMGAKRCRLPHTFLDRAPKNTLLVLSREDRARVLFVKIPVSVAGCCTQTPGHLISALVLLLQPPREEFVHE